MTDEQVLKRGGFKYVVPALRTYPELALVIVNEFRRQSLRSSQVFGSVGFSNSHNPLTWAWAELGNFASNKQQGKVMTLSLLGLSFTEASVSVWPIFSPSCSEKKSRLV